MPAFSLSRSIQIDAPVERVFASVRDFSQWPEWSPWLIAEPGCEVVNAADGNSYTWDGKVVGSGEMKIREESANESIDYDLAFFKPWKSKADVQFSFAEKDGGTEATWTMSSSLPIFLFWMKKMMLAAIGGDYERGLNMLKDWVESGSVPSKLEFGEVTVEEFSYVGVKTKCLVKDIGPTMEADFGKLQQWFAETGTQPCGVPFSIYHNWDIVKGEAEYTSGMPVESAPSSLVDGFVSGSVPRVKTFSIRHTGPYRHLGNAWSAGITHERAKQFAPNKAVAPFEFYENDPNEVAENELVTTVHFPVKS